MFIRLFVAVLASCLLCAVPAVAYDGAPPSVQEVPEPSAQQLELARRYIEIIQTDQMAAMVEALVGGMMPTDGEENEDEAFLRGLVTEMSIELMPRVMEALVPVYASVFTVEELEALVGFYGSEMGGSIIEKTIATMPASSAAVMAALPVLMDKMAVRICDRYGCDPDAVRAELARQGY